MDFSLLGKFSSMYWSIVERIWKGWAENVEVVGET
jgi:hypothetical protein